MAHLVIDERQKIEECLNENLNFTQIGKLIDKDRTSIRNEIKNHIEIIKRTEHGNSVHCSYLKDCIKYTGKACKKKCENYSEAKCELLNKPPYVCNGCKSKRYCRYEKKYYRYLKAQKEYTKELTDARNGIRISPKEVSNINNSISTLIKEQKHSVNQIYINNPDQISFSKTTFYKYIDLGIFTFRNIDLPRRVRYKASTSKRRTRKETLIRVNRTYKDFNCYLQNNNYRDISIVQMDTVEGIKGGKVFLTLLFENHNLMLIYLLDTKTKEAVNNIFNKLKKDLGEKEFKRLFEVILTDNGSEFFGADNIECNEKGNKIVSLFYCDPSASYQKGALEKNHEYIRYYLPKHSSFDDLTQEQVNLMNNHINSIPRDSLKSLTPYVSSSSLLSDFAKEKLNLKYIEPNLVNLNPILLKRVE